MNGIQKNRCPDLLKVIEFMTHLVIFYSFNYSCVISVTDHDAFLCFKFT